MVEWPVNIAEQIHDLSSRQKQIMFPGAFQNVKDLMESRYTYKIEHKASDFRDCTLKLLRDWVRFCCNENHGRWTTEPIVRGVLEYVKTTIRSFGTESNRKLKHQQLQHLVLNHSVHVKPTRTSLTAKCWLCDKTRQCTYSVAIECIDPLPCTNCSDQCSSLCPLNRLQSNYQKLQFGVGRHCADKFRVLVERVALLRTQRRIVRSLLGFESIQISPTINIDRAVYYNKEQSRFAKRQLKRVCKLLKSESISKDVEVVCDLPRIKKKKKQMMRSCALVAVALHEKFWNVDKPTQYKQIDDIPERVINCDVSSDDSDTSSDDE
jgi:hypothetical protein